MIKHSKQRERIKLALAGRHDHPTAEMLYSDLRKDMPSLSLGTVYRNLSLLTEIGEINKVSTGIGPDHFDSNVTPHNHFICKNCGQILDLEMDNIDHINDIAGQEFSGIIEDHVTYFRGYCPECISHSKIAQTKNS